MAPRTRKGCRKEKNANLKKVCCKEKGSDLEGRLSQSTICGEIPEIRNWQTHESGKPPCVQDTGDVRGIKGREKIEMRRRVGKMDPVGGSTTTRKKRASGGESPASNRVPRK